MGLLLAGEALALSPGEVVVIANSEDKAGLSLAHYYLTQRKIPPENLITIQTANQESCSRIAFNEEIAKPVRQQLKELLKQKRIRCLVTVYGVPLKIRAPLLSQQDQQQLQQLREERDRKQQAIDQDTPQDAPIRQRLAALARRITLLARGDSQAAVDSELALVLSPEYPLDGWLPNPYFLGFQKLDTLLKRDQVLMVSRLDGPDPETVRRLIDEAIDTEKNGLKGSVYLDARWPRPEQKELSGYALYDAAIHTTARRLREQSDLRVVLNQEPALFQPGSAPEAALYCGWYSLARYIPAFTWAPGSVGYHIASAECSTLKRADSQVWCKRMLEEGVAATIGPVYEPYVQAFPLPDIFFPTLVEGYLSLGEAYLISLPYLSWQMLLIGDPLYQPFQPKD
ncbi:TIGR03790 family protein [Desulfogranum mediterraneum]|uniref:TIGR03790 family protein n=1 Tax=Desulfogranum mediterraneum TaxID=160661 RepID=UPI0003FB3EB3|nr:TIGR03790 family protein [Desulfogranum mediterraneum]